MRLFSNATTEEVERRQVAQQARFHSACSGILDEYGMRCALGTLTTCLFTLMNPSLLSAGENYPSSRENQFTCCLHRPLVLCGSETALGGEATVYRIANRRIGAGKYYLHANIPI